MTRNNIGALLAVALGALLWWQRRAIAQSLAPIDNADLQFYAPVISALDLIGFDMRPRGIRNNNPGNVRTGATAWRGQIGVDDKGFCIFDTPENGIRALARVLKSYAARGIDTVREVITTWAPPFENNTGAYIEAVASACGVGADQVPDRTRLVAAIIRHENGQQPYADAQIAAGIAAA